jgi:hypothetical protein
VKIILTFLVLQLIFAHVDGQLRGKIVNEKGDPLEGVYVFSHMVQFKHAISDKAGEFTVRIDKNSNYELSFFSIDHADTFLTVTPSDSLIHISLSNRLANEKNQIVKIENAGIVNIVDYAIDDLASKIPTNAHQLKFFLRVISVNEGVVVGLLEASVQINDPGYISKKPVTIAVDQLRIATSRDSSKVMPVRIKNSFISFNPLYRGYESSHMRLIRKHGTVLNSPRDFVKDTDFRIVRHIRLEANDYIDVYFQKGKGTFSENGFIRIDTKKKSIKEYKRTLFIDDEVNDEIEIKLVERNEAYYPTYIRTYQISPNLIPKIGRSFTYNISEYFIEEFNVKIPNTNIESREPTPFAGRYVYNPTFWDNYDMLKKHPISENSMFRIFGVTSESMEKDFLENSKERY